MAILQVKVRPANRRSEHDRSGSRRSNERNQRRVLSDDIFLNSVEGSLENGHRHDVFPHRSHNADAHVMDPTDSSTIGKQSAAHRQHANGTNVAQGDALPIWQRIVWKLMPSTTVGRALNSATERLRDAGCMSAHLDAQVILAFVLGTDRSWLFAHYDYTLNDDESERFTDLIARRAASEPVAYLVGRREFYGLDLSVDQRVLIPRPETEMLVDAVLNYIGTREPQPVVRVADIGTGSGAIALALATNCVQTEVYAVDVSSDALAVAQENVRRLDRRGQVTVLQGDLLATLPEKVDIIVANLPYINSRDYAELHPTVRNFEPRLALEAGPDGLDAIRRLLQQAPHVLRPNGLIVLEIAHDQGALILQTIEEWLPQAQQIDLRTDYADLDRMVMIVV